MKLTSSLIRNKRRCVRESVLRSNWYLNQWTQETGLSSPRVCDPITQRVEGLNWTKDRGKRNSAFPASLLKLGHQSSQLGSPRFQAFKLKLNYTTGFPASPANRWQTVELLSLCNYMSQFLIMNLFLDVSYWSCFSREPWLVYTNSQMVCIEGKYTNGSESENITMDWYALEELLQDFKN